MSSDLPLSHTIPFELLHWALTVDSPSPFCVPLEYSHLTTYLLESCRLYPSLQVYVIIKGKVKPSLMSPSYKLYVACSTAGIVVLSHEATGNKKITWNYSHVRACSCHLTTGRTHSSWFSLHEVPLWMINQLPLLKLITSKTHLTFFAEYLISAGPHSFSNHITWPGPCCCHILAANHVFVRIL